MASPTEVTKVHEVQASLLPLRKRVKSMSDKCSNDYRELSFKALIKKKSVPPFSSQVNAYVYTPNIRDLT